MHRLYRKQQKSHVNCALSPVVSVDLQAVCLVLGRGADQSLQEVDLCSGKGPIPAQTGPQPQSSAPVHHTPAPHTKSPGGLETLLSSCEWKTLEEVSLMLFLSPPSSALQWYSPALSILRNEEFLGEEFISFNLTYIL